MAWLLLCAFVGSMLAFPQELAAHYTLADELGSGEDATVFAGRDKTTGKLVAFKRVDTSDTYGTLRVLREVEALTNLTHCAHVARVLDVVRADGEAWVVLSFAGHTDALDVAVARDGVDEDFARKLFVQVVEAVECVHATGYCHMDLKVENVAVEDGGGATLLDFGSSVALSGASDWVSEQDGTTAFYPPELLSHQATHRCRPRDVWALGCLLFVMLELKFPFVDDDAIQSVSITMPSKHLSGDLMHLFESVFVENPTHRLTVAEILEHPWIKRV